MVGAERPGYWSPELETMDTHASRTVLELSSVGDGEILLDVGCGSAPFISRLSGGTLVGIDPASEALEIAKTRVHALLIRASAEALPFRSLTFDRVLCHHALEHFDARTGLSEISRVLKPGHYFVLAYPNSRYLPFLLGIIKQDPLHVTEIPSTAKFPGFKKIKKYVFLNIPHLGDSLILSRIPLLRDLFYNVVVLLQKTD